MPAAISTRGSSRGTAPTNLLDSYIMGSMDQQYSTIPGKLAYDPPPINMSANPTMNNGGYAPQFLESVDPEYGQQYYHTQQQPQSYSMQQMQCMQDMTHGMGVFQQENQLQSMLGSYESYGLMAPMKEAPPMQHISDKSEQRKSRCERNREAVRRYQRRKKLGENRLKERFGALSRENVELREMIFCNPNIDLKQRREAAIRLHFDYLLQLNEPRDVSPDLQHAFIKLFDEDCSLIECHDGTNVKGRDAIWALHSYTFSHGQERELPDTKLPGLKRKLFRLNLVKMRDFEIDFDKGNSRRARVDFTCVAQIIPDFSHSFGLDAVSYLFPLLVTREVELEGTSWLTFKTNNATIANTAIMWNSQKLYASLFGENLQKAISKLMDLRERYKSNPNTPWLNW